MRDGLSLMAVQEREAPQTRRQVAPSSDGSRGHGESVADGGRGQRVPKARVGRTCRRRFYR